MAIEPKQINRVDAAPIQITAFTASGADDDVTSVITTALSTAGNDGVSVPLQVSTGVKAIGVITTGTSNRVLIESSPAKDKITDANGEEVFGRLTQAGGVYTLSYYSLNPTTGVETAYSFASSTAINFIFNYRFDFHRKPADSAIALSTLIVSDDPSGTGRIYTEKLTVTGTNAIADLTKTPSSSSSVILYVNGVAYDTFSVAAFSVAGKTITWSAANSGFDVATTDRVLARYLSNK